MDELKHIRSKFIKRLKRNDAGRTFFVGDLHGCFWHLEQGMRMADFDTRVDRIISVGDLVDRGPESHRVLEMLDQPWFHAVQGNHEDMAVWCAFGGRDKPINMASYVEHGGGWFAGMMDVERKEYAYAIMELPYLIEVETNQGLVGVVHADTHNGSWAFTKQLYQEVDTWAGLERLRQHSLWSRNRVIQRDTTSVEGVYAAIVGHTPMRTPVALGNTIYIDTGAVFGHSLTMMEISDIPDIPQMNPRGD